MSNIQFIESSHKYITAEGRELISVSKFTEKFKEKVNWKDVAKRVAQKLTKGGTPTSVVDVLNKWEKKRDISAEIGTLFHEISEKNLIDDPNPIFYDTPCQTIFGTMKSENKHSIPINEIKNNAVYPELMIYDLESGICGQSDKVIVIDNKIHIWDYKTDQEIKFEAFSSTWVKPKKLLSPLGHLDDCNGNMYSIKMSLYMYMLWKANKGKFKTGDIIIEHVTLERDPLNDNIPILKDGKPVILDIKQIKLPYRKKEVMEMLKTI